MLLHVESTCIIQTVPLSSMPVFIRVAQGGQVEVPAMKTPDEHNPFNKAPFSCFYKDSKTTQTCL